MAKGNMFQGMARGKVGDVVFYRMNGWQMSRVRNRKPKNPRTPEQMYQRAIIATVMKAYSAGKEIFDHSFENYRVGEENMRRFNSLNAIQLRNLIKQEVTNGTDETESLVRVVGPKSPSCVANPGFIVSEGSLTNNFITFTPTSSTEDESFSINIAEPLENETVKQYFERLGIYNDDIFTIVSFMPTRQVVSSIEGISSKYSQQFETLFGWYRIKMTGDLNSNSQASNIKLGEIATFEKGGNAMIINMTNVTLGGKVLSYNTFDLSVVQVAGTMAIIRSKNNSMLRSTETMRLVNNKINHPTGITTEWILDAWMKEKDQIGQSELILEGGEPYAIENELSDEIETEKIENESKKRKK